MKWDMLPVGKPTKIFRKMTLSSIFNMDEVGDKHRSKIIADKVASHHGLNVSDNSKRGWQNEYACYRLHNRLCQWLL
jgi:hypothetical protein